MAGTYQKHTYNGVTLTTKEWAEKLGITVARFRGRINEKWPVEKLFKPRRKLPAYAPDAKCEFPGCDRKPKNHGFCGKHYARLLEPSPEAKARKKLLARRPKPEVLMFRHARERALKQQVPFAITIADVVIPEYCPALPDMKLAVGIGGPARSSPSLDKIVPKLGYVPGNVQVISHLANLIKRDASLEQLLSIAEYVREGLARQNLLPPRELYLGG